MKEIIQVALNEKLTGMSYDVRFSSYLFILKIEQVDKCGEASRALSETIRNRLKGDFIKTIQFVN